MIRRIALIALLAVAAPEWGEAQQGVLLGAGKGQWLTSDGAVCNGCKFNFYIAGTSTRLDTFTSAALSVANENPVVLDGAGRAEIWLSARAYKIVYATSADVEIWTIDNYTGRHPPSNVLSKSAAYTVATADGPDTLIQADASGGAFTITLYTAVGNSGRKVRVIKTESSTNAVTIDANGSETINGSLTYAVRGGSDVVELTSNGSNWLITSLISGMGAATAVCECRLTLTSGLAVTTADVTAATTVYLTPFRGNRVTLFNGSQWIAHTFTERSLSLSGFAATTLFDIYLYDNSGTLTLEAVAWSSGTGRATSLTTQDGVYVKSGATTRLYVGTIRTTGSTGQTEDSNAKRFVWNAFNRVIRFMRVNEGTDSWNYSTNTWRQANNAAGNQLEAIVGLAEDVIEVVATVHSSNNNGGAVGRSIGIGDDSTSAPVSGSEIGFISSPTYVFSHSARFRKNPAVGYQRWVWLERSDATATTTWYGDNGGTDLQSGISATVRM